MQNYFVSTILRPFVLNIFHLAVQGYAKIGVLTIPYNNSINVIASKLINLIKLTSIEIENPSSISL